MSGRGCGLKQRLYGGCPEKEDDAPAAHDESNALASPPVAPVHGRGSRTDAPNFADSYYSDDNGEFEGEYLYYRDDEATHNHCAPLDQTNVPFFGHAAPRAPRSSSCDDIATSDSPPAVGSITRRPHNRDLQPVESDSSGAQRGQIILVATGSCMLLVSGALLMVLCALCMKRCRRRSSVQRSAAPPEAATGMQPPLWEPHPRSGMRGSSASASTAVSPKDSSRRHLYIELPDSTLALAVKDPGCMSGGVAAPASAPAPALIEPSPLDGLAASSTTALPPTIHFAHYMPIMFPASMSSAYMPGALHVAPMHAHAAGIALAGSGPLRPPSEASESARSSSVPLEGPPEAPIAPELLRRRQSLRLPAYHAHEMLASCNSDGTTEALLVRVQPPLSAAEAAAIGLPAAEAAAARGAAPRDARAAIGLPSIAPPVDAAAGGAMLAALTQRRPLGAPAIGLPVGEMLLPCSGTGSTASAAGASQRLGPGVIVLEAARSEPGSPRRGGSARVWLACEPSGGGTADAAESECAGGIAAECSALSGGTALPGSTGATADNGVVETANVQSVEHEQSEGSQGLDADASR